MDFDRVQNYAHENSEPSATIPAGKMVERARKARNGRKKSTAEIIRCVCGFDGCQRGDSV
jgi:hypothetical protein